MEILIPILFFFIIFFTIVFKILNAIRKFFFSKEGQEGDAANWKDFFKELTEQFQQRTANQQEGLSAWEQILGREVEEPELELEPLPLPQPQEPKKIPERAAESRPAPVAGMDMDEGRLSLPTISQMGKGPPLVAELQNAIVWAEILGKPVGLRDGEFVHRYYD